MKNMMKKENLMPVIVLGVICLVVAILMGGVNMITAPVIRESNDKAIADSLGKVMPDGEFNETEDVLSKDAPETISKVYTEKTGKGTVVVLVTNKGYTGKNIGITVGIDKDGKITGMQITQNEESIIPGELKPGGSYGDHYVGAGADEVAELVTGATVAFTESAIKGALADAFVYLGFAENKPELPREESEILGLAKAFYGEGAENLVSYTPEDTSYVKRIYKEKGKASYVTYSFAYSQYGTPEFEFLTYVDEEGRVADIEKILWKVSDPKPEWGYSPPSDDEVDTFFEGFVGKTASTVSAVEVETGATNTAGRVRDAALESLEVDIPEESGYAPRIIGIVALALAAVGCVAYAIISKRRRTAK